MNRPTTKTIWLPISRITRSWSSSRHHRLSWSGRPSGPLTRRPSSSCSFRRRTRKSTRRCWTIRNFCSKVSRACLRTYSRVGYNPDSYRFQLMTVRKYSTRCRQNSWHSFFPLSSLRWYAVDNNPVRDTKGKFNAGDHHKENSDQAVNRENQDGSGMRLAPSCPSDLKPILASFLRD